MVGRRWVPHHSCMKMTSSSSLACHLLDSDEHCKKLNVLKFYVFYLMCMCVGVGVYAYEAGACGGQVLEPLELEIPVSHLA